MAYKTMPSSSFTLDNVQAQFLAKTDPELPITYSVKRLSSGKRFAVRLVTASQQQKGGREVNVLCATIAFASHPAVDNQPAMNYSVERETKYTIAEITLDDLENARSPDGPFMKFQRLGVDDLPTSSPSPASNPDQTSRTTCHAAHLTKPLPHPQGHMSHILGLLNLSDYHVLDCPLTLSNLTFGLFATNDISRTPLPTQAKMFTSLNHSVYIHRWDGWRADEMVYVEGRSSWAADGRAYVTTRMFGKDGKLIASCVQEVSWFHCLSFLLSLVDSGLARVVYAVVVSVTGHFVLT